jgi:diaminohydroxyphosphoribosylaminopyrimidine deaminase/5-amino-6-(5-phosphoribosylamino)uracil reductase
MDRALALARRGVALAHPNPMVGAVVVKNGRVVGDGFHTYDGRRHAEIIAIEKAGPAARGGTLYLNLEPCCHTGRTGPCTEAILAAGIKRVVAAMQDPNPAVAGRGFAQLLKAGVKVTVGVRKEEARELNEAFARWICTGRPLVTLKSALTLDGRIALPGKSATWITSPESREEVQRLRHAAGALLTGIGTVLADNPRLTDRSGVPRRRPLMRVILDSQLRLPLRSKLARSARGDLLVFTTRPENSSRARALRRAGVEVVCIPARRGHVDLRAVIRELGRREILSVLLEGGAALNGAALREGIVDKMILFFAPKILGSDAVPFAEASWRSMSAAPALHNISFRRFGPDFCVSGYLRDPYRD